MLSSQKGFSVQIEKPFAAEASEKSSVIRYICSLYWAFATMSTVRICGLRFLWKIQMCMEI